jgi:hypothetical protein
LKLTNKLERKRKTGKRKNRKRKNRKREKSRRTKKPRQYVSGIQEEKNRRRKNARRKKCKGKSPSKERKQRKTFTKKLTFSSSNSTCHSTLSPTNPQNLPTCKHPE